jgi:hypothetical protein
MAIAGNFVQPIMSDEFGNRARPAFCLRALLVCVDAQHMSRFGGCRRAKFVTVPTMAFRCLLYGLGAQRTSDLLPAPDFLEEGLSRTLW